MLSVPHRLNTYLHWTIWPILKDVQCKHVSLYIDLDKKLAYIILSSIAQPHVHNGEYSLLWHGWVLRFWIKSFVQICSQGPSNNTKGNSEMAKREKLLRWQGRKMEFPLMWGTTRELKYEVGNEVNSEATYEDPRLWVLVSDGDGKWSRAIFITNQNVSWYSIHVCQFALTIHLTIQLVLVPCRTRMLYFDDHFASY